jgi:hypothetical protein
MTSNRSGRFGAREAYWLVLALAYAAVLHYGWPGHLSVDSVLALHEGRFGVRESWNPAFFGWLLGVFDRVSPGGGLHMATLSGLLFLGWAGLAALRPRSGWIAPLVAGLLALTPQVLIYQAIVWKDVAFANAAIIGFIALALAVRAPAGRTRWAWLAAAALVFAAGGLFRQNGLLVVAFAAAALAWTRASDGWLRSLGIAAGWAVSVALLTLLLSAVAQPQGVGRPDDAGSKGIRILQTYDLVGAEAIDPSRRLPAIDKADPQAGDYIRETARLAYSPERVDTIGNNSTLERAVNRLPTAAIHADWLDLVTHDPGLYLKLRLGAYRWVVATPVIDRCLPVHLGVSGPAKALKDLHMPLRSDTRDHKLFNYVTWFMDTPAMSHLTYGAVALALALAFLIRRGPGDIPMAGLMTAALGFTASFLFISIACDYRYLYFLDLAAITGAIYFALDPTLSRRTEPRPARR